MDFLSKIRRKKNVTMNKDQVEHRKSYQLEKMAIMLKFTFFNHSNDEPSKTNLLKTQKKTY